MKLVRNLFVVASTATLVACGGGDSPPPPTPTPTPTTATLNVALSANSATTAIEEGGSASVSFDATYTGTSTSPIVADVEISGRRISLAGQPVESGKTFTVNLETVPFPAGGQGDETVTFRLCTSAACNTVYPGSTRTFTLDLDVAMGDWETRQRNAAHTGYVAVRYDVDNFSEVWTVDDFVLAANSVAATRGGIFATLMDPNGDLSQRRIDPADGQLVWNYDLAGARYMSAPFIADGRVGSMAMDLSSGAVPMFLLDQETGQYRTTITYASQFSDGGTPTPYDGSLYFQAGYFGNTVYAADIGTGLRQWVTDTTQGSRGFVHEGQSVAVDQDYVYYFGGGDLVILTRASGTEFKRIANPFFSRFNLSYSGQYEGAPILDGQGRIFTFSDNKDEMQAVPLMAWAVSSATPLWRSAGRYVDDPAYHDGKLYAPRANSAIIDVIDAADGSILRSIPMPNGSEELHSNVILTERHLFVASANTTYAIDISQSGDPVVWSLGFGGELAITPDNLLVIIGRDSMKAVKLF